MGRKEATQNGVKRGGVKRGAVLSAALLKWLQDARYELILVYTPHNNTDPFF